MPRIDITVRSELARSMRVRQVSAMFDVPAQDKCEVHWEGDFPFDAESWNVGLIVGPSGSGKSTIAGQVFGKAPELAWRSGSVVDDFDPKLSVDAIADVCSAVGFNTIPAWLRPHAVLSNGEKFRVELARRLLELPDPIVVDEFTSVVDRQVAQIGSHAVQKYVRKHGRKFVAVSCHHDILDWLQPDWVLEAATMSFTRRRLQRRPSVNVTIGRVPRAAWRMFSPFHYLTAELHTAARCFGLWANGTLASFVGVLHRPHAESRGIWAVSRLVTPDWQGLGLAMVLVDKLGAAYKGAGLRLRTYPAHPSLIRAFDRSPWWRMTQKPGNGIGSSNTHSRRKKFTGHFGGRPNAVFEYCGAAMDAKEAQRLIAA